MRLLCFYVLHTSMQKIKILTMVAYLLLVVLLAVLLATLLRAGVICVLIHIYYHK